MLVLPTIPVMTSSSMRNQFFTKKQGNNWFMYLFCGILLFWLIFLIPPKIPGLLAKIYKFPDWKNLRFP